MFTRGCSKSKRLQGVKSSVILPFILEKVPMSSMLRVPRNGEHFECRWHRAVYFHAGLLISTSFYCMSKLLDFAFMVSIRNYLSIFLVMSNHRTTFARLCGSRTVALRCSRIQLLPRNRLIGEALQPVFVAPRVISSYSILPVVVLQKSA